MPRPHVVTDHVREKEYRGGLHRKAQLGVDGYQEMGRKGGQTRFARHGDGNMRQIAWLGSATMKRLIAKGKAVERGEA
jgi:hypothetical protein